MTEHKFQTFYRGVLVVENDRDADANMATLARIVDSALELGKFLGYEDGFPGLVRTLIEEQEEKAQPHPGLRVITSQGSKWFEVEPGYFRYPSPHWNQTPEDLHAQNPTGGLTYEELEARGIQSVQPRTDVPAQEYRDSEFFEDLEDPDPGSSEQAYYRIDPGTIQGTGFYYLDGKLDALNDLPASFIRKYKIPTEWYNVPEEVRQ